MAKIETIPVDGTGKSLYEMANMICDEYDTRHPFPYTAFDGGLNIAVMIDKAAEIEFYVKILNKEMNYSLSCDLTVKGVIVGSSKQAWKQSKLILGDVYDLLHDTVIDNGTKFNHGMLTKKALVLYVPETGVIDLVDDDEHIYVSKKKYTAKEHKTVMSSSKDIIYADQIGKLVSEAACNAGLDNPWTVVIYHGDNIEITFTSTQYYNNDEDFMSIDCRIGMNDNEEVFKMSTDFGRIGNFGGEALADTCESMMIAAIKAISIISQAHPDLRLVVNRGNGIHREVVRDSELKM